MNPTLLVVAALVFPALWGWFVYWLFERLRPRRPTGASTAPPPVEGGGFIDFQI